MASHRSREANQCTPLIPYQPHQPRASPWPQVWTHWHSRRPAEAYILHSECLWMERTLGTWQAGLSAVWRSPRRGQYCLVRPWSGMLCHCLAPHCVVFAGVMPRPPRQVMAWWTSHQPLRPRGASGRLNGGAPERVFLLWNENVASVCHSNGTREKRSFREHDEAPLSLVF